MPPPLTFLQAWHGHSGRVVDTAAETFEAVANHGAADGPGANVSFPVWQAWSKPLGEGKAAVLLINISPAQRDISIAVSSLSIGGSGALKLSDVWSGAAVPHSGNMISVKAVPPHGSRFYIAERAKARRPHVSSTGA